MELRDITPRLTGLGRSIQIGCRWRALPTIVRYGVAGGTTQVIYLGTMAAVLLAGAHYLAALLVAQLAAICFAFPTYRNLVFVAQGSVWRQLGTFLGIWWSGAAMSLVGVPALVEIANLSPLTAQLLVLAVVVVFSYLGHRKVTFRRAAVPEHAG